MMNSVRILLIGFLTIYVFLIGILRSLCWKDPTSIFFQLDRAHLSTYSSYRIQQAIRHADFASTSGGNKFNADESNPPELCIGIPSVRREGVSYLKLALGSLQHGLSPEERMRLHFVVLLAHMNQTEHPDYGEPWLTGMADKIAAYQDDEERLRLAEAMESQPHAVKSKFDYSIVMEECAKTEAPYMLIIEDDVVFLDGWRHRTIDALKTATAKSWEAGYAHFLYLRLFYYEALLGWNSESWPTYLASSLATTGIVFSVLVLTRRHMARAWLTQIVILMITFVFTPLLIILFFVAGRNSMLPQPNGVHVMDKYACCGQGLVFPRMTVTKDLLPWFRNNTWSPISTDSFIEDYADMTGSLRWALTPVVMQHVGGQSSHDGRRGDTYEPNRLWNFGFEGNDAVQLGKEHAQAQYQLIADLNIESVI
ncbi:integral membrane protein [Xylaria arbuscula]|nr:integral membrane protein [Xylaria arbuscula]